MYGMVAKKYGFGAFCVDALLTFFRVGRALVCSWRGRAPVSPPPPPPGGGGVVALT